MAGFVAFMMIPPVLRQTDSTSKVEPRPAPVEPTSLVKPVPAPPQSNDRNDETRKKISDHLGMAKYYEDNGQTNEAKAEFEAILALESQQSRSPDRAESHKWNDGSGRSNEETGPRPSRDGEVLSRRRTAR